MNQSQKHKIFISYSREDIDFSSKLVNDLRAKGNEVWFDITNIEPGKRWDNEIEEALASCNILILILSPTSVKSENVRDEYSFALQKSIKVIPVLYKTCKIPVRLHRIQYIDFTKDYNFGFQSLLFHLNFSKNLYSYKNYKLSQAEIFNKSDTSKSDTKIFVQQTTSVGKIANSESNGGIREIIDEIGIIIFFEIIGIVTGLFLGTILGLLLGSTRESAIVGAFVSCIILPIICASLMYGNIYYEDNEGRLVYSLMTIGIIGGAVFGGITNGLYGIIIGAIGLGIFMVYGGSVYSAIIIGISEVEGKSASAILYGFISSIISFALIACISILDSEILKRIYFLASYGGLFWGIISAFAFYHKYNFLGGLVAAVFGVIIGSIIAIVIGSFIVHTDFGHAEYYISITFFHLFMGIPGTIFGAFYDKLHKQINDTISKSILSGLAGSIGGLILSCAIITLVDNESYHLCYVGIFIGAIVSGATVGIISNLEEK